MSNLTQGTVPQPYGPGGRKIYLPMKATAQVYEGAMVAEVSGAVCTGTTAGAGRCIGIAESDALGGASDGATRLSVWTDKVFILNAGTNAPTDATPFGTLLYMETDNTVGTGGIGGSGEGVAGTFVGMEDDGRVRVFFSITGENSIALNGTALADSATDNAAALGRVTRYNCPTLSQNNVTTLVTTGAVVGDVIRITRTDTSAHTLAVANGGAGVGTIATIASAKAGFVQAYFDGTNWIYDGASSN